jgi:hypothetical protein
MQWLNGFVTCTSGLLGSCLRHSFGCHQFHTSFAVFESLLISVNHAVLYFQGGLCLQLRGNPHSCLVEVEFTLRLTVSQPVYHDVEPTLGLVTKYYFLSKCCCLKVAVLSLWGDLSDESSGLSFWWFL